MRFEKLATATAIAITQTGSGCLFANWRNEDVKMSNVEANGTSASRFHCRQCRWPSKLWGFVSAGEQDPVTDKKQTLLVLASIS